MPKRKWDYIIRRRGGDVLEIYEENSDAKRWLKTHLEGLPQGRMNRNGKGGSYYDIDAERVVQIDIEKRPSEYILSDKDMVDNPNGFVWNHRTLS